MVGGQRRLVLLNFLGQARPSTGFVAVVVALAWNCRAMGLPFRFDLRHVTQVVDSISILILEHFLFLVSYACQLFVDSVPFDLRASMTQLDDVRFQIYANFGAEYGRWCFVSDLASTFNLVQNIGRCLNETSVGWFHEFSRSHLNPNLQPN